jgi:hypothetical protein
MFAPGQHVATEYELRQLEFVMDGSKREANAASRVSHSPVGDNPDSPFAGDLGPFAEDNPDSPRQFVPGLEKEDKLRQITTNCAGSDEVAGQPGAPDSDAHSTLWAKLRNVAQPSEPRPGEGSGGGEPELEPETETEPFGPVSNQFLQRSASKTALLRSCYAARAAVSVAGDWECLKCHTPNGQTRTRCRLCTLPMAWGREEKGPALGVVENLRQHRQALNEQRQILPPKSSACAIL